MNKNLVSWILRIGVAGEFIGHGLLSIGGKADFAKWIGMILGTDPQTSLTLLWWIGAFDLVIAIIVLLRPIPAALLWAAFWGFWTALVRPLVGESLWDFVERWANWGAPLALLYLRGMPKKVISKEWLL